LVVCLAAAAAVYATELEEQEFQTVKAVWSADETVALVDYLYEHRSQAGNGGNFKTATFTAAAEAISPLLKYGLEKTEKICRRKRSSVSDFYVLSVLITDAYIQIKYIYSSIQKYQGITGVHWDSTHGAGINGEAEERAWNSYIAQKVCWPALRYSCRF
jgi:hypothetical protein